METIKKSLAVAKEAAQDANDESPARTACDDGTGQRRDDEDEKTAVKQRTWDSASDQLTTYPQKHGHFGVRQDDENGSSSLCETTNRHDEDQKRKLDSTRCNWMGYYDQQWQARFDQLSAYHEEHGHCNVRACENTTLYAWVRKQRSRFESNTIDENRKRRLDSIGFEWSTDGIDLRWKNMFDRLFHYQKKNGHCNVRASENQSLFGWVHRQRRHLASNILDQDRKRQLDSIGFAWTADKVSRDMGWKNMFDRLLHFQKKNGHCNVPAREDILLYHWMRRQRRYLESKSLDGDRKRQLDSIGFEWTTPSVLKKIVSWKNMFDRLVHFQKKNGHCNVRARENQSLYNWVQKQRRHLDSKSLDEDRKKLLDSIGFERATPPFSRNVGWKNMFDKLLQYQKNNGHCNVRTCEEPSLYNWVLRQRRHLESNTIDEDRKRQLDAIGFEWTIPRAANRTVPHHSKWETMFHRLLAYKEMNGHCNVRACGNQSLYRWVLRQRRHFESNSLDGDKKRQLASIGFEWTTSRVTNGRDLRWKNMFDRLLAYQEEHGHCKVRSCEDISLHDWVGKQRRRLKSNTLEEDRKRQLDSIGFEWATPACWKMEPDEGDETLVKGSRSFAPNVSDKNREHGKQKSTRFELLAEEPKPDRIVSKEITQLQQFREANGHCNVTTEDDEPLSRWVSHQRRLFRQGRLTKQEKEQLESIDGFFFVPVAMAPSSNDKNGLAVLDSSDSDHYDSYHGDDGQEHNNSLEHDDHGREHVVEQNKRPRQVLSQSRKERKKSRRLYTPPKDWMSESEKAFYVHQRVAKLFSGQPYAGTIVSYRDVDDNITYWKVEYDDGDSEEFDLKELKRFMAFFRSSFKFNDMESEPQV